MTRTRTLSISAGATLALALASALALAATGPAQAGSDHRAAGAGSAGHPSGGGHLTTVLDGLSSARGVDALGHGLTLVTEGGETTSTFSLVVQRHGTTKKVRLGELPYASAPAIAANRWGAVWLLTGADDAESSADDAYAARLFKWRPGWKAPVEVADIGAYQSEQDPDPYDLESLPGDSNPFGLAALDTGGVLVADAAGNDLLHVSSQGAIRTVARLKPREVTTPDGLPGAGTPVMSEAVATSVTVGRDGAWYVGELRGYPATAGTSEIWRIRPGTRNATCDPEHPWGACQRYADGLTSLVDLGAGPRGIYAVTLSTMTWLAIEGDAPAPGAEVGGLYLVSPSRWAHHPRIVELVPGQLTLPAGVDVDRGAAYVVGPIFGPGALMRVD